MKNNLLFSFITLLQICIMASCNTPKGDHQQGQPQKVSSWPKGITYQIFVQAFADSNGDGIGDIKGMTAKLDYLADLGVEAVWLMPISPSPTYHKYDVTDYYGIHPDYGTMDDFREFVDEAHKRNIKVVIDLVLNHSSRNHPWFLEALKDPNSKFRDYYVWAHKDDPITKQEGKIIAGDTDNVIKWNKVKGSDYLYYGYFNGGMPDLNYDNPELREEIFKIGRFWLEDVNIDGFRLDAARHIFPDDRPEDNHQWWVDFREEMKKAKDDVYLVGEVWAEAEIVAPYMKGLNALFNFDMGYAITKAVNEGDEQNLIANHKKIQTYYESVNPDYIDAIFLTNHDQNRIMSELKGNINKAKVASSILLTLPGSPYIYYGEELGMLGVKPDEYIREPFLWDTAHYDPSQTKWIEAKYSNETTVKPLSMQRQDPSSIYNHYKSLINLRNQSKALTYGTLDLTSIDEKEICSFIRTYEDESLLVVHNISDKTIEVGVSEDIKSYDKIAFQTDEEIKVNKEVMVLPAYSTLLLKK
jgi:alpha-amylase